MLFFLGGRQMKKLDHKMYKNKKIVLYTYNVMIKFDYEYSLDFFNTYLVYYI